MSYQIPEKLQDIVEHAQSLKRLGGVKHHPDYPILVQYTSFLATDVSASQRLWHVYNNNYNMLMCKVCSTQPALWNKEKGGSYRDVCSPKCSAHNPKRIKKTKDTNVKRWGSEYAIASKQVRTKIVQTNTERYGVDNPSKTVDIKTKIKKSIIKTKNVHLDKKDLIVDMIDKKYTQAQIGNELGIVQSRVSRLLNHLDLSTVHNSVSVQQQEIANFIKTLYTDTVVIDEASLISPHHIDIYIPHKKLGIEVNGVHWHSELNGRGRRYHIDKTEKCLDKDINLLQFYHFEWIDKQSIVKSMISSKLGYSEKIYARKCTVSQISATTANKFVQENHIQGKRNARYNYGLFFNGKLVSVMTLSHNKDTLEIIRFCTLCNYNVVGGASKLFKFMLTDLSPTTVMSFADSRFSVGNVYKTLGFKYEYQTPPNYWYFIKNGNTSRLMSRVQFQKHKLLDKLLEFDPDKTEWENMINNGYDRIWDCGSTKWIWTP